MAACERMSWKARSRALASSSLPRAPSQPSCHGTLRLLGPEDGGMLNSPLGDCVPKQSHGEEREHSSGAVTVFDQGRLAGQGGPVLGVP